jgi:hypothetical protein
LWCSRQYEGRLDLRPTDKATAELAGGLGASCGLGAADAIHLAAAVTGVADWFLTNNQFEFPGTIAEVDVTCPQDLRDPTEH